MENEKVVMILEDMRSDFRAFKEGLNSLKEGLDSLRETTDTRFERLEKELREFKEETCGMNKFLQDMLFEHEQWLRDHNVTIGNHETRLKVVEKKVA